MKLIKNYNDYICDIIIESIINDQLPFKFSEKLANILIRIKHPISTNILDMLNDKSDFTLIDIGSKNDTLTMSSSAKIIEYLKKELNKDQILNLDFFKSSANNEIWTRNRVEIKIGRLVKKLFGDKFPDSGKDGHDIQSFVNMYKSIYDGNSVLMEIVEGDDIIKWYDYDSYVSSYAPTPLHSSCMADSSCSDFIDFYNINKDKVKMLIQYENNDKEKIVARALLWYLDVPDGRIFMDRVYYSNDMYVNVFINYAQKNGWLYKKQQTSHSEKQVVDSINGNYDSYLVMKVKNIKLNRYYPYLDTFKYLYQDNKILSNDRLDLNEPYGRMESTSGTIDNLSWSNYYKKYIFTEDSQYVECNIGTEHLSDEDDFGNYVADKFRLKTDATYLPYYHDYIPNDLIKENTLIQTTYGQKYLVLKIDAVWLDDVKEYTTLHYADKNGLV